MEDLGVDFAGGDGIVRIASWSQLGLMKRWSNPCVMGTNHAKPLQASLVLTIALLFVGG